MNTIVDQALSLRRLWPLLALLALALFPFGWLGEVWPIFGQLLGVGFSTVLAHAIAHSGIFFLIGVALLVIFPKLRQRPWRFLAIILAAGIIQEGIQLAYKQRPIEFDELRDLVTDLIGAIAALTLVRVAARLRRTRQEEPAGAGPQAPR
jgi:hypothetical protein